MNNRFPLRLLTSAQSSEAHRYRQSSRTPPPFSTQEQEKDDTQHKVSVSARSKTEFSLDWREYRMQNSYTAAVSDSDDVAYPCFNKDQVVQEKGSIIAQLQLEFERINNTLEFIIDDGLKTLDSPSELNKSIIIMKPKRSNSLGNDIAKKVLSVAVQTVEIQPRLVVIPPVEEVKRVDDREERVGNSEKRSGHENIGMDGNRFSFSQPDAKRISSTQQIQVEIDKGEKFELTNTQILEQRILLLENKIKIYDSVFQSQEQEITALLEQKKLWEQQQSDIPKQRVSLPALSRSPTHTQQGKESKSTSQMKMLFEKVEILEQENKQLQQELKKVSEVNKRLKKNQRTESQHYEVLPTPEDQKKVLSRPNQAEFLNRFNEVDQKLLQLEINQKELRTRQEMETKMRIMADRIRNLELECDRYKNINNFLHRTIQENKNN